MVPRPLVVLTALCVALGAGARFVADSPLWLDEALSAGIAALEPGEVIDALGRDGHPPAYYLLLHGWMRLVGTGDVAVRALSGILSIGALPLVFVAGRRRGGPVVGTIAVAVLALSPFAIRYGSEARMYSLVMVEVLVGWLLVDDLREGRPASWRAPALAATSGALLLTHYWGMFLVAATVAVAAAAWWRAAGDAPARRALAVVIVALGAGGLALVPWLPTLADQLGHTGTPWAPPTRPTAAVGATLRDVSAGPLDDGVAAAVLVGVLALLGLAGRRTGDGRVELIARTVPTVRAEALVAALTLGSGASVAYLGGSTFATRYAAVVVPLLALVVAAGVAVLSPEVLRTGALAALAVLGGIGVADQLAGDRTQAEVAAAAVRSQLAQPGAGDPAAAVVVTCPDQLGPATARALWGPPSIGGDPSPPPDGPEIVTFPDLAGPRLVDWYDYAERLARVDEAAVAAEVVATTPAEASIFLVWHGSYRLFEGRCEALRDVLAAARPGATELVRSDAASYYEPATVTWFPPVRP